MRFLSSRTKAALSATVVASVSFGITAAVILSTSAQAAPINPAPEMTATPQPASAAPVKELTVGEVYPIDSADDISFPIDAYRPAPDEENRVLLAEYGAMTSCMARYGFTFDLPVWTVPAVHHDYDRLFGVLDLAEAARYGYHLPDEIVLASGQADKYPKGESNSAKQDPVFMDVALGDGSTTTVKGKKVPDGGCMNEARTRLGDDNAIQTLVETAVNYGLSQSDSDPRVAAAFESWSECMAGFGLHYATPREAINDPQWASPEASAAEIETATSDIKCKSATGLTGLRVAVASAWQAEYIDSHAQEFAAATRSFAAQFAKADSLL